MPNSARPATRVSSRTPPGFQAQPVPSEGSATPLTTATGEHDLEGEHRHRHQLRDRAAEDADELQGKAHHGQDRRDTRPAPARRGSSAPAAGGRRRSCSADGEEDRGHVPARLRQFQQNGAESGRRRGVGRIGSGGRGEPGLSENCWDRDRADHAFLSATGQTQHREVGFLDNARDRIQRHGQHQGVKVADQRQDEGEPQLERITGARLCPLAAVPPRRGRSGFPGSWRVRPRRYIEEPEPPGHPVFVWRVIGASPFAEEGLLDERHTPISTSRVPVFCTFPGNKRACSRVGLGRRYPHAAVPPPSDLRRPAPHPAPWPSPSSRPPHRHDPFPSRFRRRRQSSAPVRSAAIHIIGTAAGQDFRRAVGAQRATRPGS